jgi:hypothetical protein
MGEQLTGKMEASADVLDAAVRHVFYISTHVGEGFYFENVARYHHTCQPSRFSRETPDIHYPLPFSSRGKKSPAILLISDKISCLPVSPHFRYHHNNLLFGKGYWLSEPAVTMETFATAPR